jgi:hypothetical protein
MNYREPVSIRGFVVNGAFVLGWFFWMVNLDPVNVKWNYFVTYGIGFLVISNFLLLIRDIIRNGME